MSALWAILTALVLVLAWAWFLAQVGRGNSVRPSVVSVTFVVRDHVTPALRRMQESLQRVTEAFKKLPVVCPNCKGKSSRYWPGGPCTVCGGTGQVGHGA